MFAYNRCPAGIPHTRYVAFLMPAMLAPDTLGCSPPFAIRSANQFADRLSDRLTAKGSDDSLASCVCNMTAFVLLQVCDRYDRHVITMKIITSIFIIQC